MTCRRKQAQNQKDTNMGMFSTKPRINRYKPNEVKLSHIFRSVAKSDMIDSRTEKKIRLALYDAGYKDFQVKKILDRDVALGIDEMKQIISHLNDRQIFGNKKNDINGLVEDHLKKEAIKKLNIANVRYERMLESRVEDIEALTAKDRHKPNEHQPKVSLTGSKGAPKVSLARSAKGNIIKLKF